MQNEPHDADNEPQDVAALVARLSEAQKRAVLRIGDDVVRAGTMRSVTGAILFKLGIISMISAGGYAFTNLTPLGQRVADHLRTGASHADS